MTDFKKYLIRFGFILLITIPILSFTQGAKAIQIITYKVCLVALAIGLCELVWVVFYKPVYGATEAMSNDAKQIVMLFRGILYAAVILALTLGL